MGPERVGPDLERSGNRELDDGFADLRDTHFRFAEADGNLRSVGAEILAQHHRFGFGACFGIFGRIGHEFGHFGRAGFRAVVFGFIFVAGRTCEGRRQAERRRMPQTESVEKFHMCSF